MIRKNLAFGKRLTDLNLRVTYYSRVSTDHEEQKNSLKNQIDHFEEMIRSNHNWIYSPGYVDEGISGTIDIKRINFMKMVDDAKNGLFDLIITKEISRFSRNTLDSIRYTRELLDYGVAVYFLNDNINTALPDSELRLTIMASMAQDEVRRLSERVKFGMQRSIKNGVILGNDLMYGYKKDKVNKSLVIDKEEAEIVRRIFSLYVISDMSLTSIVNKLNEEGIKTSLNRKWNVTTLSRMIKNPKYKGFYCGKKSEVVDYIQKKVKVFEESEWVMYEDYQHIPPIINESLFALANEKLMKHSKTFQQKKVYPLSLKLKCQCGYVFYKRKMSRNKDEIVWFCSNKECDAIAVRESELYVIFNDIISIDKKRVKDILNTYYNNCEYFDDFKNYEKEINNIRRKKDKILDLNVNGILSDEEFKIRNEELNESLELLNNKQIVKKESDVFNYEENIFEYLSSKKFIDSLIKLVIEDIEVIKIKENKIILNIFCKMNFNENKQFSYEFKRGFDTVGTRRYFFYYQVYLKYKTCDKI